MKKILMFIIIALAFGSMSCYAQSAVSDSNSGSNSTSTSSTQGNVKNDVQIVSSAPDSVKYSGHYGVSNVPNVVAPGIVSSYGSDSCLGSASGGGSIRGFGLTFAKTTTDEGCTMLRSTVRIYEMADWHRIRAIDYWKKSNQFNAKGQKAAQYYRDKAYKEELVSDELAQGGIFIQCQMSKKIHDALVMAGIKCPKFEK